MEMTMAQMEAAIEAVLFTMGDSCLLYTSPSPRDA